MTARYPSTVMVSVVCPWDERDELDEAVFRRAIRFTRSAGFRHIYVFGTAGEGFMRMALVPPLVDCERAVSLLERLL